MTKFKLILLLIILFYWSNFSFGQDQNIDTIIHSTSYEHLDFHFSSNELTLFEVKKTDIRIVGKDTTKFNIETDTFSIQLLFETDSILHYEIQLSNKYWKNALLLSDCQPSWWDKVIFPNIMLEVNTDNKKMQLIDCQNNVDLIKKGYEAALECIENSEDKFMKEYVQKWIEEEINQCEFQKKLLFQDVGMITSNLNMIIPIADTIKYTFQYKNDSLTYYSLNLITIKSKDQSNNSLYTTLEDTSNNTSTRTQLTKEMYSIFEETIDEEQRKKDAIRLSSLVDSDFFQITIDNDNNFLLLTRNMQSSMLNKEMVLKKSMYEFTIRKIN